MLHFDEEWLAGGELFVSWPILKRCPETASFRAGVLEPGCIDVFENDLRQVVADRDLAALAVPAERELLGRKQSAFACALQDVAKLAREG